MDAERRTARETELKEHTEILEYTFERLNLKVMSIAYSGDRTDSELDLWVELTAINGGKIKTPRNVYAGIVHIKVNFYENGCLLCSSEKSFDKSSFCGYDTIHIDISYDDILSRATSARLFAII